jgi:hypothetical protein
MQVPSRQYFLSFSVLWHGIMEGLVFSGKGIGYFFCGIPLFHHQYTTRIIIIDHQNRENYDAGQRTALSNLRQVTAGGPRRAHVSFLLSAM